MGFRRFSERRIPGKNGEGTPRILIPIQGTMTIGQANGLFIVSKFKSHGKPGLVFGSTYQGAILVNVFELQSYPPTNLGPKHPG